MGASEGRKRTSSGRFVDNGIVSFSAKDIGIAVFVLACIKVEEWKLEDME